MGRKVKEKDASHSEWQRLNVTLSWRILKSCIESSGVGCDDGRKERKEQEKAVVPAADLKGHT